jgi:hypothetical protein
MDTCCIGGLGRALNAAVGSGLLMTIVVAGQSILPGAVR